MIVKLALTLPDNSIMRPQAYVRANNNQGFYFYLFIFFFFLLWRPGHLTAYQMNQSEVTICYVNVRTVCMRWW